MWKYERKTRTTVKIQTITMTKMTTMILICNYASKILKNITYLRYATYMTDD